MFCFKYQRNYKEEGKRQKIFIWHDNLYYHFAGVERIELSLAVLETAGLPLTDTPKITLYYSNLWYYFAMQEKDFPEDGRDKRSDSFRAEKEVDHMERDFVLLKQEALKKRPRVRINLEDTQGAD